MFVEKLSRFSTSVDNDKYRTGQPVPTYPSPIEVQARACCSVLCNYFIETLVWLHPATTSLSFGFVWLFLFCFGLLVCWLLVVSVCGNAFVRFQFPGCCCCCCCCCPTPTAFFSSRSVPMSSFDCSAETERIVSRKGFVPTPHSESQSQSQSQPHSRASLLPEASLTFQQAREELLRKEHQIKPQALLARLQLGGVFMVQSKANRFKYPCYCWVDDDVTCIQWCEGKWKNEKAVGRHNSVPLTKWVAVKTGLSTAEERASKRVSVLRGHSTPGA